MDIAAGCGSWNGWPWQNKGLLLALLVAAGAGAAGIKSTTSSIRASELTPAPVIATSDDLRPSLIGSYEVSGTEPDGTPYGTSEILDVAMTPSGALELSWDSGRSVGIGQLIGNVLAVASVVRGRTAILIMNINPDGSLTGRSLRRTDRGQKGTEIWKRI
jgi:hypothetical protein